MNVSKEDLNWQDSTITSQSPQSLPNRVNSFLEFEEKIMNRKIGNFVKEDLRLFNNRFVTLIYPRGHGKTTTFTVDYAIYNLYKYFNFDICLTSSSLDQSWKFMEIVQTTIETNEKLNWMIPQRRSEIWNKSQINTSNNNRYFIKPLNDTIRGTHVDLYILDDILRSEEITQEQVRQLFWSLIFPTVQTRKGQLLFVGTPHTTDDLFNEIESLVRALEGDQLYEKKCIVEKAGLLPVVSHRQAVITDDMGNWLRPLWPELFSLDELRAIRELQGSLAFDREYMTNPRAGGSSIFKEEMLKKRHSIETSTPRPDCFYFLGHDSAISEDSAADFTVFDIIEMDMNKNLKEAKLERYKGKSTSWQLQRVRELHKIFNFRNYVPEDMGLAKGLVKDALIDDELKNITKPFITSRVGKELLISRIETALTSGQLTLLDNPIRIDELRSFGIKKDRTGKETYEALGGHDDTVMALGLALEAALGSILGTAGLVLIGDEKLDEIKDDITLCPQCIEKMEPKGKGWFCEYCSLELSN